MKKILAIAALIGTAYFGFFTVPTAQAAQITNGGTNPYGGNVCIDVKGGATAPFTPAQAWSCHGWMNQQWSIQGFTIFGIGSTGGTQNCLDVRNAGTAAGTTVAIYPCNGTVAQQWYFYNGLIYNPNSKRCLDAGDRANGTQLVINDCVSNKDSQLWQIK